MRRLARLAARTPADRERYLDLLRAMAIMMVVLGHWAVAAIRYDEHGQPDGHSALPAIPWAYPLTWAVQVMPVFFLVGGYANAASLAAHRGRGGDAAGWLLGRSARLLRPTSALVLVLAGGALVARVVGVEPSMVRTVVWFATIPLWFLAAYLVVVPLTPLMYALHRRFGLAVPVALALLVAAGDLGRAVGPEAAALPNYLLGWLAVHQVGFAWFDARRGHCHPTGNRPAGARLGLRTRCLPMSRRAALVLLVAGLGVAVLLTGPGPYPVSMINLPGQRLDNAAPPSVALLAVATAQLGLILLLRERAERWLHRSRPWQAVIAVNSVVLTVFLWHLSAVILLVGALDWLGVLPTPPAGSAAWLAWRLPWVLLLAVVLAALVAVFGPIEARTGRSTASRRDGPDDSKPAPARTDDGAAHPPEDGHPPGGGRPISRRAAVRGALTVAGFAAVGYALVANSATAKTAPEPLGLPVAALVAYLAGAGVLRLLRSGWGSRG
ncbi:acyltransferase family protein [Micromonospora craniellae]|uniref:Acyltransferase n=1 Tax=Micromonospora craniellae TaxID=2294034 RepID=A0A372FSW6_9ACTN|nr:acyltransferase [Micromonospora craniellae]QOC91288.1 acyltransferase [Micromonospora craniellae]RFS43798.1 acyltransferase [Micromonospora craniellae]